MSWNPGQTRESIVRHRNIGCFKIMIQESLNLRGDENYLNDGVYRRGVLAIPEHSIEYNT
jgi:hypothetical protein